MVDSFHHRRSVAEVGDEDVGGDVGRHHRDDRGQPDQRGQRRLEVHPGGAGVAAAGHRLVDQVGGAAGDDHEHAHHEDPHQELDLDGRLPHGEQDEGDERDAGDAVGLEAVGARPDRVAGIVAGAVGDHAGVAGVVLLDVEDDLHEVGADVGDLREDAARDPEGGRSQRLADGEADEARPGIVARDEEQDAEHQEQLDADQQHADRHPRLERDGVDGEGLAPQAGEGRARVGEGVDADAEPGDAVAAGDADQAEEQDDDDPARLEVQQETEVQDHDDPDEDLEQQDELALRDQVRLAGLVDQLGDLPHRLVHGHVLELPVDDEPEHQPQHADGEPQHEQGPATHAGHAGLAEVRNLEVRLASGRRGGRAGPREGEGDEEERRQDQPGGA